MPSTTRISPEKLMLVAAASIAILIFAFVRPPARTRIAPPWAAGDFRGYQRPEPRPQPQGQAPTPQPIAGVATQLNQLDIIVAGGLFADPDQQALSGDLQEALAYVSERFGHAPTGRIKVSVANEGGCSLHGIAFTDVREVQVFTCNSLPRSRAVNILAHEFVHQLAQDQYGPRHLSADMILLEGLATWGAGKYWLGGQPSFAAFVRPYRDNNTLLPLATSYEGRGIAAMNQLYYEWASFVDFLISTYGRDKFDALYVSGSSSPGSADYAGVYGKGLDVLESEWRDWLGKTQSAVGSRQ